MVCVLHCWEACLKSMKENLFAVAGINICSSSFVAVQVSAWAACSVTNFTRVSRGSLQILIHLSNINQRIYICLCFYLKLVLFLFLFFTFKRDLKWYRWCNDASESKLRVALAEACEKQHLICMLHSPVQWQTAVLLHVKILASSLRDLWQMIWRAFLLGQQFTNSLSKLN